MIRVTLKGLLGRKFRASLTALAIVLGVAMISGTFVLTDTISKAFDQIFANSRKGTSVVISGKKVVERSFGRKATVPSTLLERVRKLPGVQAAAGATEDVAKVIGRDGKAISTFGPPTLGEGIDFNQPRFNPYTLVSGRWPRGPSEVAIDKKTAGDEHFKLGSRVGVSINGPVRKFTLTATLKFGTLSSLGGGTFAVFSLPTAQKVFQKEGRFDSISVAAKSGIAPLKLVREITPLVPASVQVKTAAAQAKSDSHEVKMGVSFLSYALLAFGGIALFVGAFVIFNTLSITVAQRTREFATLRTLGAKRRQVLTSVVVEAAVIGAISSVIGLFLGLALAKGLKTLFLAIGLDLPAAGTVFAARTIIAGLLVGIVITVVAGLFPALRATRVPPIAAVREGAQLPRSRLAPFAPYIAVVAIAIALALLGYGMFVGGVSTTQRLVFLALGSLMLFMGVALLSVRIVRPLASVLGRPSEQIGGVPGRLARQNSTRNPSRTAATAAALMIGLALVTFVAVLGEGLKSSVTGTMNKQVQADYVVSSQNTFDPFPAAAGDAVATVPEVEVASSVRGDQAKVLGSPQTFTAIDPATIRQVYDFEWKKGSDAAIDELGQDGAIVASTFANPKNLHLGDRIRVITPNDRKLGFVIKGIYKAPALGSLLGAASISKERFDATFPTPRDQNTYIEARGGPSETAEAALKQKLKSFPDTKLQTKHEFVKARGRSIGLVLSLLYVLLALSVIVSLFGMINTLALSIVERTRELGMVRAVGMNRRQVRRMVRHESVITALIGAAFGLPLGIFLAALVSAALSSEGIVFAVPVRSLLVFALVALLAGILAAIIPARRASRLNVLEALQYE
jgi:putative ABC transport system permease protein